MANEQEPMVTENGEEKPKIRHLTMREKLQYPIPAIWGLLALFLFLIFSVVTQIQFNSSNSNKIFNNRYDIYLGAIQDYNNIVQSRELCLTNIEIVTSVKDLFDDILDSLKRPDGSNQAAIDVLKQKVEDHLIVKDSDTCPKVPTEAPRPPER